MKILNYEDARIKRIDLSSADFTVEDAAFSYGNGIFWYPSHAFNIVVPETHRSIPPGDKELYDDQRVPERHGYFATDSGTSSETIHKNQISERSSR